MALTETNAVTEVTILPLENNIQVKWRSTVLKDDEVIAERDHYKLFGPEKYAEFLAEVEGAEAYISALGWTGPVAEEAE
jgi:hypothetical protein